MPVLKKLDLGWHKERRVRVMLLEIHKRFKGKE
jgi:hypothetical protein